MRFQGKTFSFNLRIFSDQKSKRMKNVYIIYYYYIIIINFKKMLLSNFSFFLNIWRREYILDKMTIAAETLEPILLI